VADSSTHSPIPLPHASWREPEGLRPRGTLIVLAGRGESVDVYARFGARLAADAYRVHALPDAAADATTTAQAVDALLAGGDPRPHVLVGSDAGALVALALATDRPVDAVVAAGLPTTQHTVEDEVDARTACPVHRAVAERAIAAGALARLLPDELLTTDLTTVPVPVLALHGEADTVSPLEAALARYAALSRVEVATVRDGRHDVLNDLTHRSVAATVVLFLERLRDGAELRPIVTTRAAPVESVQ
jgi:alpha-beta hydrolase superfamily lysophospholipase